MVIPSSASNVNDESMVMNAVARVPTTCSAQLLFSNPFHLRQIFCEAAERQAPCFVFVVGARRRPYTIGQRSGAIIETVVDSFEWFVRTGLRGKFIRVLIF
jgi:hypothetical protein